MIHSFNKLTDVHDTNFLKNMLRDLLLFGWVLQGQKTRTGHENLLIHMNIYSFSYEIQDVIVGQNNINTWGTSNASMDACGGTCTDACGILFPDTHKCGSMSKDAHGSTCTADCISVCTDVTCIEDFHNSMYRSF